MKPSAGGMWDSSAEGQCVVRDNTGLFLQVSGPLLRKWGAEKCPVQVLLHTSAHSKHNSTFCFDEHVSGVEGAWSM